MGVFRLLLYSILFLSVLGYNEKHLNKLSECEFITCRDCCKWGGCVWNIFYNGDERCDLKSKWTPGVEAKAEVAEKCSKPDCVVPKPQAWGLKGVAQMVGGLLGGLTVGLLAGVGIQNIRSGRNRGGYRRIGEDGQSWREFLCGLIGRTRRVDGSGRQSHGNDNEVRNLSQNDGESEELRECGDSFLGNDDTNKDDCMSPDRSGPSQVVKLVVGPSPNLTLKGSTTEASDREDFNDTESVEGIEQVQSPSYYETDDEV